MLFGNSENYSLGLQRLVFEGLGAVVLAKFLERAVKSVRLALRDARALELGVGCGLAGCVATLFGVHVLLTALPDRLKLLRKNFYLNVGDDARGSALVAQLVVGHASLFPLGRLHIVVLNIHLLVTADGGGNLTVFVVFNYVVVSSRTLLLSTAATSIHNTTATPHAKALKAPAAFGHYPAPYSDGRTDGVTAAEMT
ncbi:hypothetical protein [Oryza sativa Japonica Group]|uniref:Uncharacterized protein n=1 Tax=Oryza sativa subsp. japonica TaxID=39947 RepID=Q5ZBT7_ORYSJ|nr:hypothetical protein [Oryza sativa Japonica Group]